LFDRETDIIIKKIIDHLPSQRSGIITLREILAADIPTAIKAFFRKDVEANLHTEILNYRSKSKFTFNHPEVKNLQDQINVILILEYRFPTAEFHKRLDEVVHMIINYLVRPQWTLTNVLFEHDEVITVEKLNDLLGLFHPYEYLQEIIGYYVKEKNITSLTRDEFKTLVWKADGEYMRRRNGCEAAGALAPLYTFFDFPEMTGNNPIPIRAITKFFEDKGLHTVVPRLEGEIVQGKNELRQSELSTILDDLHNSLGSFIVEKSEVEDSHEEKKSSVKIEESPATEEISPPSSLEGKFLSENIFTDSERRRIIRKIFKDDEQLYGKTITALTGCTTWKQASKVIDEVFITFNIDPYGGEAEKFTSTIMKQFYRSS
jgi:hypothetical protein